jgi:hypothetical protein
MAKDKWDEFLDDAAETAEIIEDILDLIDLRN